MRRYGCALAVIVIAALAFALGAMRRGARALGSAPVDVELMAFLSQARALHHQANLEEQSGDLTGAAEAMDRLIAAQRPHAGETSRRPASSLPEVDEVLADAYARLGELHLRRGALDAASAAVKDGLEHAPETTYFRGHLLEVDGLVEEARVADLSDAGKADEAARARDRALRLLEEVVRIQGQVIERSLARRDAGAEDSR